MTTGLLIENWRTTLAPSRKTIYTTNGYSLSEITRNDEGEQIVSYEITDPSGNVIEESESVRDTLTTLAKIIFSKTKQTTFYNVPDHDDFSS